MHFLCSVFVLQAPTVHCSKPLTQCRSTFANRLFRVCSPITHRSLWKLERFKDCKNCAYRISTYIFITCKRFNNSYVHSMNKNTCDCRIYVPLGKIYIRQYGRRFAYSSRNFIIFSTETQFHTFSEYLEQLHFEITFKLEKLPLIELTSHCCVWKKWQIQDLFKPLRGKGRKRLKLNSNKKL